MGSTSLDTLDTDTVQEILTDVYTLVSETRYNIHEKKKLAYWIFSGKKS